jgi:hypothetical protein
MTPGGVPHHWMEDAEEPQDSDTIFASHFASAAAHHAARQDAKNDAQRFPIRVPLQPPPPAAVGLSPISTHPIILRNLPVHADSSLNHAQTSHLLRTIKQRDLLILQALHDYRYLNTLQAKELFFPSLRSAQMRLQFLEHQGLIYRWKVIEPPGVTRRPSMLVLSPRGARVLANHQGDEARLYVERSREARDHCWHAIHDLEANQFFIWLATQSRELADQGLFYWYGEDYCRSDRVQFARERRLPAPIPDGMGVYLAPTGRIIFDLEWDRATESHARLRQRMRSYVRYFKYFRQSELHHVLFVVPGEGREEAIHQAIRRERPRFNRDSCCTFWTTTASNLRTAGPLGRIWLQVDWKNDASDDDLDVRLRVRTWFAQLPPLEPNTRPIEDCIGKPRWWDLRPGGGQAG